MVRRKLRVHLRGSRGPRPQDDYVVTVFDIKMGCVKEFRFRHEPVILVATVFAFAALEKFKRAARDGFIDPTGLLQGSVDSHRSCLWRAWHRPHRDCGSRAHECTLFFRYILILVCASKGLTFVKHW